MKKYKIELTTTELQKLSIFLVMYEKKLLENSKYYEKESKENLDVYTLDALSTIRSNAKWYKKTYQIIHKIREKLDSIPF